MRITNIQKKELSDIFVESGLNVMEFETSGQHKEFKVKFKHEYFSFSINIQKPNEYYLTIFPVDKTEGHSVAASWIDTKKWFGHWAKQIANELNTSTGWETFQNTSFLNSDFIELENKFNESEKEQTKQCIIELREKIKGLELPQETIKIIDKKLDELSNKVDDLSKFDWKSLFIGSMASLTLAFAIPPETNGMLWEYIKNAFRGLKLIG